MLTAEEHHLTIPNHNPLRPGTLRAILGEVMPTITSPSSKRSNGSNLLDGPVTLPVDIRMRFSRPNLPGQASRQTSLPAG